MKPRILATALTLICTALLPAASWAWWGGPNQGHNGYYGMGPVDARASSGFSFGTSFSGRGNTHNRYGAYNGYPQPRPTNTAWILRGVNFKYDSAELKPGSMEILDSVASTLREHPNHPLEVGGHASAEGKGLYNLKLSDRRAQTVRAYLVKRGVNPQILTYRGYGETRPLVANYTEAGRKLNRRVELSPALNTPPQANFRPANWR